MRATNMLRRTILVKRRREQARQQHNARIDRRTHLALIGFTATDIYSNKTTSANQIGTYGMCSV
jgi:hypothetical protein